MSAERLELHHRGPRGEGQPVLFVHGFSHSGLVWEPLMETLPKHLRPIAVDLRGHGESPWSPLGRYGVEDYAGDLVGALDRSGIDRAVVVGHSLGGNAATLFAAEHPQRVEALLLVDTGPALVSGALARIASDVGGAFGDFASVDDYAKLLQATHPLGASAELARLAEGWLAGRLDGRFELCLDPGTLAPNVDGTSWAGLEARLWDALGRIDCPTLLVRGGLSSVLSPEVAQEMTGSVLRAGELVTLERAGHAVMIDDLPGLRAALDSLLARIQ
jgi:pimeloyl-ACP methyl ester carboxylesterase